MSSLAHIAISCAPRSGSTLLLNLMNSFKGLTVYDKKEHPVVTFRGNRGLIWSSKLKILKDPNVLTVTKFPRQIFFAEELQEEFSPFKIGHILITRDPRDVITSKLWEGYHSPLQYCINFRKALEENRGREFVHVLSYEDLVQVPDKIQKDIAKAFSLTPELSFTEYWDKVCSGEIKLSARSRVGVKGAREFDTKSIGQWKRPEHRSRVRTQIKKRPEIKQLLIEWGYEEDN